MQNRRQTLKLLGITGALAVMRESANAACTPTTPAVTEGPYWVDEKLFRSDIRTDPSTNIAREGVPLQLTMTIINASADCAPLVGAYVDIWHCDAVGIYSDESTYNPGGGTGNVNTKGQKFLRGYQITDVNGQVRFTSIYPGWYSGRTIHIHVRVRTYDGTSLLTDFVTQVFFDDTVNNTVMALSPYNKRTTARDTTNGNDMVYNGAANRTLMLASLTQNTSGYSASITIDASARTTTSLTPVVAPNAIVNAASGVPGIAPGTWVSIFGTNLSPTTYTVGASDIVDNQLPTSLQNVSVQIDGQPAYVDFISDEQINVLIPDGGTSGSVSLTVANANGISSAAKVTMQSMLPGLFVTNGYVRADAAAAGDVIELYGTGFGPTSPAVTPGLIFSSNYPEANPVTVSIGGVPAIVTWAGMIGAGLYQINVAVPSGLSAGDNAIVASVNGYNSQSGALLKIAG